MTDDGDMTGSECLTPKRRDDFERMGETHLQNRMFTDPAFHGQLREAALEWLCEKQDAREEEFSDHDQTRPFLADHVLIHSLRPCVDPTGSIIVCDQGGA